MANLTISPWYISLLVHSSDINVIIDRAYVLFVFVQATIQFLVAVLAEFLYLERSVK
jgi:hypothetical protein